MANLLLSQLNALLSNIVSTKTLDKDGQEIYTCTQIFTDSDLEIFLSIADTSTKNILKLVSVENYSDLVVEYAAYLALMSRSVLEKGREYAVADGALSFDSPQLSYHMFTIADSLVNNWFRKVQLIRV